MFEELLKPSFTPLFVLLTCVVFAWIGYIGHGDGDQPPGGANA
ncbi:MAG: hypothetical protein UX65_C0010G0023 [Parcubacteria group bacterium GW2011_GWB1_46_8]|nr:MAG: hypothetical protein UX65_C0010G0023 [Parcubacteria group bacterium GW2011_GWB1_46_8]